MVGGRPAAALAAGVDLSALASPASKSLVAELGGVGVEHALGGLVEALPAFGVAGEDGVDVGGAEDGAEALEVGDAQATPGLDEHGVGEDGRLEQALEDEVGLLELLVGGDEGEGHDLIGPVEDDGVGIDADWLVADLGEAEGEGLGGAGADLAGARAVEDLALTPVGRA